MTTAENIPAQSPVYFMEFIMEYSPTATGRTLVRVAEYQGDKVFVPDIDEVENGHGHDSQAGPWEA